MADSITITLSTTVWTDMSALAANGLLSNESNYTIVVKEAATIPDPSDITGHSVFAGPQGFYNWAGVTQIIWARALPGEPDPIKVEVTRA